MIRTSLLILLVFLFPLAVFSQYYLPVNKVWAMGKNIGLDFNAGPNPVLIQTSMQGSNDEGCAAVADAEAGTLLFYANGDKVWNRAHNLMPNGVNLPGWASSTQGSLIVPVPGAAKLYYLFTLNPVTNTASLYCNRVDMNLHNGYGDVDTTFPLRNTVLKDSLSEKMTAVPGCSSNIWVIVHANFQDKFYAFEVTASGINPNPVVSTFPPVSSANFFFGTMKASTTGDKIALGYSGGLCLYDFNTNTGLVTNRSQLDNAFFYSTAFSPAGTKLYARSAGLNPRIYQFDLAAANPATTKIAVDSAVSGEPPQWADIKLGPDGKIYAGSNLQTINGGFKYLSRINNPEVVGSGCNFETAVPGVVFNSLMATAALKIGLPNDVVVAKGSGPGDVHLVMLDTIICRFTAPVTLTAGVPAFLQYQWDNGVTTSSRAITQGGIYWVKYFLDGCTSRTDTFKIKGDLPPLTIVLNNNMLSTTNTFTTYQWYKGSTPVSNTPTCPVSGNAWYSVKVTGAYGCSDSAAYNMTGTSVNDPALVKNSIRIFPNPVQDKIFVSAPVAVHLQLSNIEGKTLLKGTGKTGLDVTDMANGIYFVLISDENGTLLKVEKVVVRHGQ